MEEFVEAILNYGNTKRIKELFSKAEKGEKITFVALGGSITQGFCASSPDKCYAALVARYLTKKFPKAKINFINAGIGATGSLIGVHRLKRDVLAYKPDLVTVEYCVNDLSRRRIDAEQTYFSVIQQIYFSKTQPAVILIDAMKRYGVSMKFLFLPIAQKYNLPFVSIYEAAKEKYKTSEDYKDKFLTDAVHPTDAGHKFSTDVICSYLEKVYSDNSSAFGDEMKQEPVIFDNADILYFDDIKPEKYGCFEKGSTKCAKMPVCFSANKNGEEIVFKLKDVRTVNMLYERSPNDHGKAEITTSKGFIRVVDSDFSYGWGGAYAESQCILNENAPCDFSFAVKPILKENQVFNIIAIMIS